MKGMIKRLSAFLLVSVLVWTVVPLEGTYAADVTSPVVNSVCIKNADSVDAQQLMQLEIDVTEAETGVREIILGVHDEEWNQVSLMIPLDSPSEEGNQMLFTGKYTVYIDLVHMTCSGNIGNKEYEVDTLILTDLSGNEGSYGGDALDSVMSNKRFTVVNSPADATGPLLNSFSLKSTDAIDAHGSIAIELDITEEESGLAYVWLLMSNQDGHTITLESDEINPTEKTGVITVEVPVNNKLGNGLYTIDCIHLIDAVDNRAFYNQDDLDSLGRSRDITIVNSTADISAPVINSVRFSDTNVVLPYMMSITFDITEEEGIHILYLIFHNEEGHELRFYREYYDPELFSGEYELDFPLSPFAGDGTYTLDEIQTTDMNGNGRFYYNYDSDIAEICENPSFTLHSAFDITYMGSLSNVGVTTDAINELGEGETAVIDCRNSKIAPKELFLAFAGKDKTVVFEDEDVQWVFDGKRITEERCKDINLETYMYTEEGFVLGYPDEENVLVIEFQDNGLLPGEVDIRINDDYITKKYGGTTRQCILSYAENKEESLPIVEDDSVEVEADNAAVFSIEHNSDYVLSETEPQAISITDASFEESIYTYSGESIEPFVYVMAGEKQLNYGQFLITYLNNKDVGTATAIITGTGVFTGIIKKNFTISPMKVAVPKGKAFTFNGATQTGVSNNEGYTVTNGSAKQPGSYTATLKLISKNYAWEDGTTGDKKVVWSIAGKPGWWKINNSWYYFKNNGTMATGWQKVGGTWYYLKSNGVMATGWQKVGGTWYFLKSSGAMATGWQKVGGTWYYLKSSGAMATGWQKVGGTWYYLKSSGAMATGWQKIGGTWYYLKSSGAMVTGTTRIGGKRYRFASSGAWIN